MHAFNSFSLFLSPSPFLCLCCFFFSPLSHCQREREGTVIRNWRQLPPHRICIGLRTFRNKRRDKKRKTGMRRQEEREKEKTSQKKKSGKCLCWEGKKKSKLTAVEIRIKLCQWQISSLAASSIKNLPTCLSVPLSVSADFRSSVYQNSQSKTVSTKWWHSGTIVQHGRCDRADFIHRHEHLLILRFLDSGKWRIGNSM